MLGTRLRVGDAVAVLRAKLGIHQRDRAIHRFGMTGVVGGVVRERAERERILVDVLRVAEEHFHEVAAADVVQQVAEQTAAERIVADVLNHRATVRERARVEQLLSRRRRETTDEERPDPRVPQRVDVRFVGQHGIRSRGSRCHQDSHDGDETRQRFCGRRQIPYPFHLALLPRTSTCTNGGCALVAG